MVDIGTLINLVQQQENRWNPGFIDYSKPKPKPPPGKYQGDIVGSHYYGEDPSGTYIYSPVDDQYHMSRKAYEKSAYDSGLVKRPPNMLQQMEPALLALGAKELVTSPIASLKGGYGALKDLGSFLGLGGDSAGSTVANTVASNTGIGADGLANYGGIDSIAHQPFSLGSSLDGAGTASAGADSAGGLGADTAASGSGGILSALLPALGVAAGAYTGLQQFGGIQNALNGKGADTTQKLALALPTFGASLIPGLLDHVSTAEREKQRWGDVSSVPGAVNAQLANHPTGDTGIYSSGPHAGQKWSYETALEDAKQNPLTFQKVLGNYQTYGADWEKYTPDQQKKIIAANVAANNYTPNEGDILIKDQDKGKQIAQDILSGKDATDPTTSTLSDPNTATRDAVINASSPTATQTLGAQTDLGPSLLQSSGMSDATPLGGSQIQAAPTDLQSRLNVLSLLGLGSGLV